MHTGGKVLSLIITAAISLVFTACSKSNLSEMKGYILDYDGLSPPTALFYDIATQNHHLVKIPAADESTPWGYLCIGNYQVQMNVKKEPDGTFTCVDKELNYYEYTDPDTAEISADGKWDYEPLVGTIAIYSKTPVGKAICKMTLPFYYLFSSDKDSEYTPDNKIHEDIPLRVFMMMNEQLDRSLINPILVIHEIGGILLYGKNEFLAATKEFFPLLSDYATDTLPLYEGDLNEIDGSAYDLFRTDEDTLVGITTGLGGFGPFPILRNFEYLDDNIIRFSFIERSRLEVNVPLIWEFTVKLKDNGFFEYQRIECLSGL